MIIDNQTNFLYLAGTLPTMYPGFYERFKATLDSCSIPHALLEGTNDVWAVDYMPVQVENDRFVQFIYNPDYLQDDGKFKWQDTITDARSVCRHINISCLHTNIVLDGGNIVRSKDKVIITDKVFRENPEYSKSNLVHELEKLFETGKIIFIPEDPSDFTGHADGMARFVNEDTVVVNQYPGNHNRSFRSKFLRALHAAGLQVIEIPYNPYNNDTDVEANGIYVNYLHMYQAILLPVYGMKEDEQAVKLFGEIFSGQTIKTVDSNEIAKEGGVLNCISWNIYINKVYS